MKAPPEAAAAAAAARRALLGGNFAIGCGVMSSAGILNTALAPPAGRGQAITFIFLGWSLASVLGMPMAAWIGETLGWRWAFAAIALLALAAAAGVWRALPAGIRPPALELADWRQLFTQPVLMAIVLVTAFSASGQFTLFAYLAPYFAQMLGASAGEIGALFLWFGLVGLAGNVALTRLIDRTGAPRAVAFTLGCMALSMLIWPLAGSVAAMFAVCAPWALGCFASNSAQQARLALAAPALATALIALNRSAMYAGQFVDAGSGGAIIAATGCSGLHWAAFGWLAAAIALSVWAARRMRGGAHG